MSGEDEERLDARERKRPTHLPNMVRRNTSVIVFVTVCAADRAANTFATDSRHQIMRDAWALARSYLVGAYVLMPDHVHLFCAPAVPDAENVTQWVRYWKSLVTRGVRGQEEGGSSVCLTCSEDEQTLVPPALRKGVRSADEQTLVPPADMRSGEGRASARPVTRMPSLFQRDCWDTQLRRGENYHEKWEYIRNNPVRRGLVGHADAWPYGGVLNELVW